MARRLPRLVLSAAALWFAPMLHADDTMPIAHYAFEAGEALDTGPDSFAVFEPAHGDVTLTAAFRVSGRRAVLLHDVPGDGDFPELQGYFPLRTDGVLSIRFALMTPDPAIPWNVALAGPEGFMLRPGGIAFWLEAEDGVLRHVSDSIPKRLLSLRSFVWYFIEVRYDVAAGSYDLTIREESREAPLIDLRRQPGASAAIASPIDKFSFVGDVEHDAHASDLFVDDEEVKNLRIALQGELPQRHFGDAVRLEVADLCPAGMSDFLLQQFGMGGDDLYQVNGPVNLVRLMQVPDRVQRADLKFAAFTPGVPGALVKRPGLFAAIARQDVLLHHPFQSFKPVVNFVQQAAEDPNVVAIKQTVYRTGAESELMRILVDACRRGKEITVVVEREVGEEPGVPERGRAVLRQDDRQPPCGSRRTAEPEGVGPVERPGDVETLRVVATHLAVRVERRPQVRAVGVLVLQRTEQHEVRHASEMAKPFGEIDLVMGERVGQRLDTGRFQGMAEAAPRVGRRRQLVVPLSHQTPPGSGR